MQDAREVSFFPCILGLAHPPSVYVPIDSVDASWHRWDRLFQEGRNIDPGQKLRQHPHQPVGGIAAARNQNIRDNLDVAVFDGGCNQLHDLDLLDGLFTDRLLLLVVGLGGRFTDSGDLGCLAVADGLQPLALRRSPQAPWPPRSLRPG